MYFFKLNSSIFINLFYLCLSLRKKTLSQKTFLSKIDKNRKLSVKKWLIGTYVKISINFGYFWINIGYKTFQGKASTTSQLSSLNYSRQVLIFPVSTLILIFYSVLYTYNKHFGKLFISVSRHFVTFLYIQSYTIIIHIYSQNT